MRYLGSKRRMVPVLKEIVENVIDEHAWYVEPFMGGCNSLAYINHPLKIGNDNNQYIYRLWKNIQDGTFKLPEYITEYQYYKIKDSYKANNNEYPDDLIGFVGACCSFGGAWFNGYAKYNPNKDEDHILEAINGLKKQINEFLYLKDTIFLNVSYDIMNIANAFIYCDPPYLGTKEYKSKFNTFGFWNWAEKQIKRGNILLVSEYNAPDGWREIWKRVGNNNLAIGNNSQKTEKLFVHEAQFDVFQKKSLIF